MYIVALVPEDVSSFFGTIHQLFVSVGFVVVNAVGTKLGWRDAAWVGAGICALLCILVWLVPEPKPRAAVIRKTGESVCATPWRAKLILSILLMFFQQLSGINAILLNLTELFKKANINLRKGYDSAVASCAQVIACLVAGFVIQKFGRKIIWVASFAGIALTDILYGLTQRKHGENKGGIFNPRLPVVFIFLNLLAFGIGAGPIPWFIVPQMFGEAVRDTAMSITSAANWLLAFAVVLLFDVMKKSDRMGTDGSFYLYGAVSAIGAVYGAFFVPKEGQEEYKQVGDEDNLARIPPSEPPKGRPLIENKDL
jgi:MFS family permease